MLLLLLASTIVPNHFVVLSPKKDKNESLERIDIDINDEFTYRIHIYGTYYIWYKYTSETTPLPAHLFLSVYV
jgi:hypothetical protein